MVDQRRLMMELYGDQQQPEVQLPWLQQQQPQASTKTLSTRIQELLGAREPNQGGMTEDILSARFKPNIDELGQAASQTFLTGKPVRGQDFSDQRQKLLFDRLNTVKQLEQQRLKDQMDMLKFQETMRHNRATEGIQRDRINSGAGYIDPITGEIIQNRKLSSTEQKELLDAADMINAAGGAKGALQMAQEILRGDPTGINATGAKPYTGWLAEERAAASRVPVIGDLIADKERGAATTEYRILVMEQALNNLKAIFGGMPTEGERQVLLQMQALPNYTPEEQERIIKNALAAADKRIQFNQAKSRAIQTGDYGALTRSPVEAQQVDPRVQQALDAGYTMEEIQQYLGGQ